MGDVAPRRREGDRLAGAVAIVTGAGHEGELLGTGAAISMLFAAQGAQLGLVDIDARRAGRTLATIAEHGGEGRVVEADVSTAGDCRRAVEEVVDRFGRLDVLVNNVAIAEGGSVVEFDEASWDRTFAVNLKSVALMSGAAIPHLRASGGGSIVNVSSIAAMRAFGVSAYAASKAGVMALTRDIAFTHGRDGIRVNCIVPGHLFTPMGDQGGESLRDLRRRAGLLGTEGDAWDVAWAALFLASDEARWITAVNLPVDAGTTATAPLAMRQYLVD
jgi:NAD(P)-dependent dehydrogenase (short-subunit alcohol dehydrogenase family)